MNTRSIMIRYPGKGWRRILVVITRAHRRAASKGHAQRRYIGRLGLWTFQSMREAAE